MCYGFSPELKPSFQSIEEQIQIIHRIQLSDFENATMKITDIQSKLQDQIVTQAQEFRWVTYFSGRIKKTSCMNTFRFRTFWLKLLV